MFRLDSNNRRKWPFYLRAYAVLRQEGWAVVKARLQHYWAAARTLGIKGVFSYLGQGRFSRLTQNGTYWLYSKESHFPLECRKQSSDRDVFEQIFVAREYDCLQPEREPQFILDGGANVGYSAAYLLTKFPQARLLAVEADDNNFPLLERNLAPFGERAQACLKGIWSHETGLAVCRGQYKDGREWATQVRECTAGEKPDIEAIDIGALLAQSGFPYLDILKLDIEGSEAAVFSRNYEAWIDKVGAFIIELHDEECQRAFHSALGNGRFRFSYAGDIAVAQRVA